MKTIKMLFAVLGSAAFFAACNNPGNDQQQDTDTDTTYMEPTPPANDTLMTDTMMTDTM